MAVPVLRITSVPGCNLRRHHRVQPQLLPLAVRACEWLAAPDPPCKCANYLGRIKRAGVCRVSTFQESRGGGGDAEEKAVPLRIAVGTAGSCYEQVFNFRRILGSSSVLVVVTLSKPLGIVFQTTERDEREYVVVEQLVLRSNADRSSHVAQMFRSCNRGIPRNVLVGGDVRLGDVLRASTAVEVVVDVFGLRAPRRVVVLFQADGRSWTEVMCALNSSFVADGPVTLVLERPAPDLPP